MDCATLIAGHRAIAEACRAMLATLADVPVDINALARDRMALSMKIRDHIRDEDRMILPVLTAHGKAPLPTSVRDVIDRRARLMQCYSKHVGRWNLSAVSADTARFHVEVAAHFDEAFALMAAQERTLYPYIQSLADRPRSMSARPAPTMRIAS